MELTGQVAIVTGAGSGLGRAIARGLAREGATVLVVDVRESPAEQTLREIHAEGGSGDLFIADISREERAREAIEFCVGTLNGLDLLVNNAGLRMEEHEDGIYEPWRCVKKAPVHELAVSDWDLVLNVNLRGAFLCTRFAIPHMIKQRRGTIISISSNAGSRGVPGKAAYCASKHAVEGLTKSVAEEVLEFGISVNAIHPGGRVDVDGRGGLSPDVVVPIVSYLARQDAPAVSGQIISAKDWNRNALF